MKKVIVVVAAAVLVFTASANAVVITNPGFEDGDGTVTVPPGWTAYGRGNPNHMVDPPSGVHVPGINNESTYQLNDDRAPEGSRSYSIHKNGDSSAGIYQVVDVTGLDGLSASLSAFTHFGDQGGAWHEFGIIQGAWSNPDNLDGAKIWAWKTDSWGLNGFWNDGSGTTGTASQDATTVGNWKLTTVNFTIPEGVTQMTIYVKDGAGSGIHATWLDDVVLTPEPTALALMALGFLPLLRRRRT